MKTNQRIHICQTRQASLLILAGLLVILVWPLTVSGQESNTGSYATGRAPLDGTKKQVGQSGKALGHELLGKPNPLSLSEYMIHDQYTTFNCDTDPTYEKIVESFFDPSFAARRGRPNENGNSTKFASTQEIILACIASKCWAATVNPKDVTDVYQKHPILWQPIKVDPQSINTGSYSGILTPSLIAEAQYTKERSKKLNTANWSFNLGYRYDENNGVSSTGSKTVTDSKVSPRLGFSYDLTGFDNSAMSKIATEISIEKILIQLQATDLTDEQRKKLEDLLKKLRAAKEKQGTSTDNDTRPELTADQDREVDELRQRAQEKLQRGDTAGWREDTYASFNLFYKYEEEIFQKRVKNNEVSTNALDGVDEDETVPVSNYFAEEWIGDQTDAVKIPSNFDLLPSGAIKGENHTIYNYAGNGEILKIVALKNGSVVIFFKDGRIKTTSSDGHVTILPPPGQGPPIVVTEEGMKRWLSDGGAETSFWFFDHDNVEMVIKALDATNPAFTNFLVFAGSLTNVGFEMTVTDTPTGDMQSYSNSSRNFKSVGDTNAF